MRRRRNAGLAQPSLVPLADMLTNTVGIVLFILIFAALSAGGAVTWKHLPRERVTKGTAVWMLCAEGRLVHFDSHALSEELATGLGRPSYDTAGSWARKYAARTAETADVRAVGEATAEYMSNFFGGSVHLNVAMAIRAKPGRGDDEKTLKAPGSALLRLLAKQDVRSNFIFFFVDPPSIPLFRAAREVAAAAGYDVGWTPLAAGEPARISLAGGGRQAHIQ